MAGRAPIPHFVGCLFAAAIVATTVAAPASASAPVVRSCPLLGTVGTPDLPPGGTEGLDRLPLAPNVFRPPAEVDFRDTTTTYNGRWDFTLDRGTIYTKPRSAPGGWRVAPVPACLTGDVSGISADDDELLAVTGSGAMYTMDHAMNGPALWNWTNRWGVPLWGGPGQQLPPDTIDWSWSVLSPTEDVWWSDPSGHRHQVGAAKVSHVYALTGAGNRIVYMDPWLPLDYSYQVQAPVDGRFKATRISVSGSTLFVTDGSGDMYTRQYDFDTSGSDSVFFRYSYQDQQGKPTAPDAVSERLDPHFAAIQLPAESWQHQPKIPGVITDEISIAKTGVGSRARELRVEGLDGDVTGYWHKMIDDASWTFTPTHAPLRRAPIPNPPEDTSAGSLAAAPTLSYRGVAQPGGYTVTVSGFDATNEHTPLIVDFADGARLPLVLHTVDGLRQLPRASGLDDHPRVYDGAIEVPASVLDTLGTQPRSVRSFVETQLGGRRFTATPVQATSTTMTIGALDGLTLTA